MALVSFHCLFHVHDINFLRFEHIAYSPQDGRAFARIAFGGVAPSFVFWLSLLEEAGEGERGLKGLVCPPPLSLSLSLYAQPPPPGPKRTFHSFSADSLHGSLGTMAALSPPPLAFHSILPPFGARLPRGRSLPLSTVVGATNCARLFDSCCPPPSLLTKLSSFLYGRLGKDGISTLPSISYYSSPVFPSLFKRRGLPPLLASCLGLVKLPSFPASLHSIWTIHFLCSVVS